MIRRVVIVALAFAVAAASAACSGSSGTYTQSLSPTSPRTPATADAPTGTPKTNANTSSRPSTSAPNTRKPSEPTSPSIPTPTVAPAAQGAVNAYIGMGNVLNRWDLDPRKARSAELQPYVTSSVLNDFMRIFHQMAAAHLAYRGNPDTQHLKVVSATSSAAVLSNCPTPAAVNPSIQYNVLTGKPLKTTGGGPYRKAITVVKRAGAWRVNSITSDTSKACKP